MPHYDILTFRPTKVLTPYQPPRIPVEVVRPHFPSIERQWERLADRFETLHAYLQRREVVVQESQDGVDPDHVLVFEVIGNIEGFVAAINRIQGFTFLTEEELDGVEEDEDFYVEDGEHTNILSRRLYATLTNAQATQQLYQLWLRYSKGEKCHRGEAGFWHAFQYLRDVRYWGVEDRISDTGVLEMFQEDIEREQNQSYFEIELWFLKEENKAIESEQRVRALIEQVGGTVHSTCRYPQIGYHAMAVSCPLGLVRQIVVEHQGTILDEGVVKLFKPIGQCISKNEAAEGDVVLDTETQPAPPVRRARAALLDGLPVENHVLLTDHIVVDDPDNFSSGYQAPARIHGTMMASLIIHDDLNKQAHPIDSQLYVRPIMKMNADGDESVPQTMLMADILHRAVVEMVRNPQCADIRVVNLSIAIPGKMFAHTMSAEAKMIDWLSEHYHLLFVISAGNHPNMIEIDGMTARQFLGLTQDERHRLLYKNHMDRQGTLRLFAPAESFNNLTIGATHDDCFPGVPANAVDILAQGMPELYSAMGLGVGNAIKPDCVLPGGRQNYNSIETVARFRTYNQKKRGPGQLVASPETITSQSFSFGTSNATALATRECLSIYDIIENIPQLNLPIELQATAIRALFIHSCSWNELCATMQNILPPHGRRQRQDISKLIGYGVPDISHVQFCTDEKVIFVGYGQIAEREELQFSVPLPPCLISQTVKKKLTITLAWQSKLTSSVNGRQLSHLFFIPVGFDQIGTRCDSDRHMSRHGTIQHEVFEGCSAATFIDGTNLIVKVIRKKDGDVNLVGFVLALTLEVAEGIGLPIYQEVHARIQSPVRINL